MSHPNLNKADIEPSLPRLVRLFHCPRWYMWKNLLWRFAIVNPEQLDDAKDRGARVIVKNLIFLPHQYYQLALYGSPKSDLLHLPSSQLRVSAPRLADMNSWSGLARYFRKASKLHPDLRLLKVTFWLRFGSGCIRDYATRPLSWVVDGIFKANAKVEAPKNERN